VALVQFAAHAVPVAAHAKSPHPRLLPPTHAPALQVPPVRVPKVPSPAAVQRPVAQSVGALSATPSQSSSIPLQRSGAPG
jgi:hypothetical protein